MTDYLPEGRLIQRAENRLWVESIDSLAEAMHQKTVIEAVAERCDSEKNLHVRLGHWQGVIPRDETALGLREGTHAAALINAPDVLLEVGEGLGFSLSAGNRFFGEVARIERGAVSAHVLVQLPCGCSLVSDITLDDVDMLGLMPGSAVFAAVSSNDVVVSCEG